ncbi:MAG: hypothetical protein JOZ72_00390 [Alphaproteobacteria bacterium]|nr:hypothetical protein [Alphaproteobacteria bacterium]
MTRVLLLSALLVAPAFAADAPALPPVPDGKTRLIVIRESSFSGMLAQARFSVDGNGVGSLGNGDGAAFDGAPGELELSVGNSLNWYGGMKATLTTAAGETHYIAISPNGWSIGPKAHDAEGPLTFGRVICSGSWCLTQLSDADAAPLLKDTTIEPPKN